MKKGKDGFYCKYVKRILDIAALCILILPATVIVAICYLSIKAETEGPAFFVQQRPGKGGKIFNLYKLRTMIAETERNGVHLTDMERMTKTGKVIRACSFDELPQLWNILKGDMSFIGPRPLLEQYLPLYSSEQAQRHEVLPGISGWAQVNGRNELSWEQKFERDVWYVDHVSFILDVKIMFMTVRNVLKHQGINAGINDTMEPFQGSAESENMSNA
ncbi:MAG TPA: sugar transferase [Clostridiales bacterium]|nr:sugar transferase [Clostridiales bacterium]